MVIPNEKVIRIMWINGGNEAPLYLDAPNKDSVYRAAKVFGFDPDELVKHGEITLDDVYISYCSLTLIKR